jgi:hypothetical protein
MQAGRVQRVPALGTVAAKRVRAFLNARESIQSMSSSTFAIRDPGGDPIRFAYWVPNVSGGLVISNIEQRTSWDIDYNRKLAQTAENNGFDYAGFKTNLIGTPEQIAQRIVRLKRLGSISS